MARTFARFQVESIAVDGRGTRFLVQAGTNGAMRHRVDEDARIPVMVQTAISRGETPLVLAYFDSTQTVRRLVAG